MIFDVSASIVVGVVGWKESLDTVIAPPRMVVSLPPVDVVRVAQPETKAVATSRVASESLVFMGDAKEEDGGRQGKVSQGSNLGHPRAAAALKFLSSTARW